MNGVPATEQYSCAAYESVGPYMPLKENGPALYELGRAGGWGQQRLTLDSASLNTKGLLNTLPSTKGCR